MREGESSKGVDRKVRRAHQVTNAAPKRRKGTKENLAATGLKPELTEAYRWKKEPAGQVYETWLQEVGSPTSWESGRWKPETRRWVS